MVVVWGLIVYSKNCQLQPPLRRIPSTSECSPEQYSFLDFYKCVSFFCCKQYIVSLNQIFKINSLGYQEHTILLQTYNLLNPNLNIHMSVSSSFTWSTSCFKAKQVKRYSCDTTYKCKKHVYYTNFYLFNTDYREESNQIGDTILHKHSRDTPSKIYILPGVLTSLWWLLNLPLILLLMNTSKTLPLNYQRPQVVQRLKVHWQ